MIKRKKIFSTEFVLMFIFFALFVLMVLLNLFAFRFIHWLSLAIFIIPPVSFFGIVIYKRKQKMKTIMTILSVLFVFITLGNLVFMITDDTMSQCTSTYAYERIMKNYGYPASRGVAHFPPKIPADARNIYFYDMPAWIDGPYICLRYEATPIEIDDIYTKYSATAKKVLKLRDHTLQNEGLAGGIEMVLSSFMEVGYEELPEDFDLILIEYSPSTPEENNLGHSYGLAISRQRNEVIYFYEDWE